jgi:hypothetical protein
MENENEESGKNFFGAVNIVDGDGIHGGLLQRDDA